MARINLEKKPRDFGLPAPLSRCALVCSRSSALLRLCAQTFGCVSRLFPVCSSCLNGCPCVPSPTANTKTLTSCPQTNDRPTEVKSSSLAFRSGVLWVFCGYANAVPAGCLPCDRACPSPLLGPTGVRAVALRRAFLTHSVNLLPTMSQRHCNSKIRSQFQQIKNTIGLKSS